MFTPADAEPFELAKGHRVITWEVDRMVIDQLPVGAAIDVWISEEDVGRGFNHTHTSTHYFETNRKMVLAKMHMSVLDRWFCYHHSMCSTSSVVGFGRWTTRSTQWSMALKAFREALPSGRFDGVILVAREGSDSNDAVMIWSTDALDGAES